MAYTVVDDNLIEQLKDPRRRQQCVVLSAHPDFPGHWLVEGFSNDYLFDLGEQIGSYRALAPSGLPEFMRIAEGGGYQLAFFEDPTSMLDQFEHLNDTPDVAIQSSFPNTVQGMLPYQVQGYNALKDLEYGVARWSTGTGKTVLAAALAKHHQRDYDICFFVVKKNNKVNTERKLAALAGLAATRVVGTRARRDATYASLADRVGAGEGGNIVVLNYEQFKDFVSRDESGAPQLTEVGKKLFTGTRLMFLWDEMPTKLKSRTSLLYKTICKLLYTTSPPQVNHEQLRPATMRAYMLSATPIENSPLDWFHCVRLLEGGRTYGTVSEFNRTYVASWNFFDPSKPESFHNLERMRLRAQPFVHQVSKSDPDIAAVFPKAVEEVVYIDWPEKLAAIYTEVQALARNQVEEAEIGKVPIFSLIGALQMLCDAPEMLNDSAARREIYEDALQAWQEAPEGAAPRMDGSDFALKLPEALRGRLSNHGHPKLEKLHEILIERHPDAQVAIYTRFNKIIMPYLEGALEQWGISYGRYDGSESHRQVIQDSFQAGEIRVFLASDSASDSLDLDAGNVVIDYNLPWKWTTLTQRHNRVHRPTSNHDTVYYYSLLMEGSVEERTLEIIETKRGYHNELFDPAAGDLSASARLSKQDLLYILTGVS